MKPRDWIEREKYVIIHGQTARVRMWKYLILISICIPLGLWKGWMPVLVLLACLFVLGIFVHFLFRYKTKAWTQDWGPYTKMDLPK